MGYVEYLNASKAHLNGKLSDDAFLKAIADHRKHVEDADFADYIRDNASCPVDFGTPSKVAA